MSEIAYCVSWFWPERDAIKPISQKEARQRHAEREEYTAVFGGFASPEIVVLLARGLVGVAFPDRFYRRALEYHFYEEEPGRLFLAVAIRRTYIPATDEMVARMEAGRKKPDQPWAQFCADMDKVVEGTSLSFEQDNSVLEQWEHFAEPYDYRERRFSWDTSELWEPYPELGQYDHLLERERELPWGLGLAAE